MGKVTPHLHGFYLVNPHPPDGAVDCDGCLAARLFSCLQCKALAHRRLRVLEAGCDQGLNLRASEALT